jgi:cardiolipin synthase
MMQLTTILRKVKATISLLISVLAIVLLLSLSACNSTALPSNTSSSACQSNCQIGSGVQHVQLFIEPQDGYRVITNAIASARKSVWVEMYLLTENHVIKALEEAAHRGLEVRVMLEEQPYGVSSASVMKTLDRLSAAGVQTKTTSPSFSLTHEKCLVIDTNLVSIMTANFTVSALGGSNTGTTNREYGLMDHDPQDIQTAMTIFQADWNRTAAQVDDPNLVVSPLNSRNDFTALINAAHQTLLIEAEEMQDSGIEQAMIAVTKRGVQVQVILPVPSDSASDYNRDGVNSIMQGGVQVREDGKLYMHAKIIVVDGQLAFVGSVNISTASLERNRELGVIVADAGVIGTLQRTFQQDWRDAQGV